MSYLSSNPYVLNLVPLFDVANPSGGNGSTEGLSNSVTALQSMINTTTYTLSANAIRPYNGNATVTMTGLFDVVGSLSVNGFPIGADDTGSNFITGNSLFISTGSTGLIMSNTVDSNASAIQFITNGSSVFTIDGIGRAKYVGDGVSSNVNRLWVSSSILYADRAAVGLNGTSNLSTSFDVWGGDSYFNKSIYVKNNVHCQNVYQVSDKRFKTDVEPLVGALSTICELKGVHYNFGAFKEPSIGFIAQEVYPVVPEAVNTRNPAMWAVDYSKIIPLLVEAVKELAIGGKRL
jgi:hypothetical protein